MKFHHHYRFVWGNWLNVFNVNRVVRNFVLSDMVLFSGWGLLAPVFSIFIIEKVPGATLATVGITASLYWLIRAAIQLPVATALDHKAGERDNFYVLLTGLLLASLAALLFTFVETITELYLIQALQALGFGLYAPAWSSIYNHHLDKNKIAFDLSLDSTALALSAGTTGFFGGLIAQALGFEIIFLAASFLTLIAAVIIFLVPDLVFSKKEKKLATEVLPIEEKSLE